MNSNRLVGLISRFTLAVLCLISFSSVRSYSFDEARADIRHGANVAKEKIKQGVQYIFSRPGVKDLAAAYCVLMGSTMAHQLGHAFAARVAYGIPVKIRVGAKPSWGGEEPFAEVAGVGIVGLNPLKSYSLQSPPSLSSWHPLKSIAMGIAGPILGSSYNFYMYHVLKHTQLPIAKFTALSCGLRELVRSATRQDVSGAVNIVRNYNRLLELTKPYRNVPMWQWNMEDARKVYRTLLQSDML